MSTKLEMLDIFQSMRRWFNEHKIDPKTVKVEFSFASFKDAGKAEASFKQEMTPRNLQYMNPNIDAHSLMGIEFSFVDREKWADIKPQRTWTEEEVEMARQERRGWSNLARASY